MRNILYTAVILTLTAPIQLLRAAQSDPPTSHAVLVTGTASSGAEPSLTLHFEQPANLTPTGYTIYRKLHGTSHWGVPVATLPGTAISYTDNTVQAGLDYDYKVDRLPTGTGYIYGGVAVALPHNRGKLVLLVDETHKVPLAMEIARFEQDLTGDGWTVIRHDVPRGVSPNDSGHGLQVQAMRGIIKSHFDSDPQNVKGVVLLGHVAVPYSGWIALGGHTENGAIVADTFYGEVTSGFGLMGWADTEINTDVLNPAKGYAPPIRPEGRNLPGDGKFDLAFAPSALELMVGRIDLSAMSAFSASEVELLRQYLNKDHAYRMKSTVFQNRGYLDSELPALFGHDVFWRGLAAILGGSQFVVEDSVGLDWGGANSAYSYLWAQGLGYGTGWNHQVAGMAVENVIHSSDYANGFDPRHLFVSLYGSYIGDYDSANSVMRAPLCAQNYSLATIYGSPPIHHMALGMPIGENQRIALNESHIYNAFNEWHRPTYWALNGDPTLRIHIVSPPTGMHIRSQSGNSATFEWNDAPGTVAGYSVYRAPTHRGPYTLLNPSGLTSGTRYTTELLPGHSYMVRAVALQSSGSGTYYNASQGAFTVPATGAIPLILSHPSSQLVTIGRTATFAVGAAGSNPSESATLTYQWRKNGVNIAGANRSYFVIPNTQATDAGIYDVIVSHGLGNVTSSAATLSVHHGPTVMNGPVAVSLGEGASTSVNLAANFSDDGIPSQLNLVSIGLPRSFPHNIPSGGSPLATISSANPPVVAVSVPSGLAYVGQHHIKCIVSDGLESAAVTISLTVSDTSVAHHLHALGLVGVQLGEFGGLARQFADGSWELEGVGFGFGEGWFEQRTESGDFTVVSRIKSVRDGIDGMGGVMIRESNDANARFVCLAVGGNGSFIHGSRTTPGTEPIQPVTVASPVPSFPNAWVALDRRGDLVFMYVSSDGVSWTPVGTPVVLAGLTTAVTAGLFSSGVTLGSDYESFSMQLVSPVRSSATAFQFGLTGGRRNSEAAVEYSEDLISWSGLGTVSLNGSGTGAFNDSATGGDSQRYYRARVGPFVSRGTIGFLELNIPGQSGGAGGWAMVANPLTAPPNTLGSLMPNVPHGTIGYKWNEAAGSYDPGYTFLTGQGWTQNGSPNSTATLAPGEGIMMRNPGSSPMTITFVGDVLQGPLNTTIPGSQSMRGSKVPQSGTPEALGIPVESGDIFHLYDKDAQSWSIHNYYEEFGGWDVPPELQPGQAFFVMPGLSTTRTWVNRLRAARLSAGAFSGAHFQLEVSGPPNSSCEIQTSADLVNWTTLDTVILHGPSAQLFVDTTASGTQFRCYRVNNGTLGSINAVGFNRVTIPGRTGGSSGGWAMVANHFNAPPNTLASLMPGVPNGTTGYKWNEAAGAYEPVYTFLTGQGWTQNGSPNTTATLAPGEGMMMQNAGSTPMTLTFVGEVLQGAVSVSIPGAQSIRSWKVPRMDVPEALGFPLESGDSFHFYDKSTQLWTMYNYVPEFGGWDVPPILQPGEAFFVMPGTSAVRTWTQRFGIWP